MSVRVNRSSEFGDFSEWMRFMDNETVKVKLAVHFDCESFFSLNSFPERNSWQRNNLSIEKYWQRNVQELRFLQRTFVLKNRQTRATCVHSNKHSRTSGRNINFSFSPFCSGTLPLYRGALHFLPVAPPGEWFKNSGNFLTAPRISLLLCLPYTLNSVPACAG